MWFPLDYLADFVYALDIAFHFRTGFLDDGVRRVMMIFMIAMAMITMRMMMMMVMVVVVMVMMMMMMTTMMMMMMIMSVLNKVGNYRSEIPSQQNSS